MRMKYFVIVILGAGLSACGGGGSTSAMPSQPAPPAQPQPMMLSVNDVLAKAKVQSDTDDPFAVDGGAATVSPMGDEQSDPASVN